MAQITGAVNLTGMIAPTDTTDVYPTHASEFGKGGYKEVADLTARDSIPVQRRVHGMLVTTQDTGKIYRLGSNLTNSDWSEVSMPDTTDALAEGSTNLWYTDSRVQSVIDNNTAGFLTSYTETDPIFSASDAAGITSTDISNWNTAHGWGDHGLEGYATETYVSTAISNLVDSAPGTLDTLNELAAALGDDPNFATTITNSIATKANSADLATVATTGSYNDLINTPTNVSDFTNDSGYITASSTETLTNKSGNISQWTNDVGYLTSETDSQTLTFSSPNLSISNGNTVDLSALLDDTDTTYTAGTGLDLTGTTFSIDNTVALKSELFSGDYNDLINTPTNVSDFTNDSGYATETYVNTAVSNLVDTAPAALDTLNELAASLGDDPNFATTVTNNIATKVSKSGDTMTGALTLSGAPVNANHAATKAYVDSAVSNVSTTVGNLDTDDVPEGSVNLYYTDARVDARIPTNISSFTNDVGYITGYVDTNDYVDSASFNTISGNLTLTRTGSLNDIVVNLDGRYITPVQAYSGWELRTDNTSRGNIDSNELVNFIGGTNVTIGYSSSFGNHVTINASDTNDIDYINSASFNTTNGVLTLSGVGNAGATVDLDGRYSTTDTTYSQATNTTLGLVKIGYSENGKNYPVELSNGQMFVNVPWTDTNTDTDNYVDSVAFNTTNGILTLGRTGALSDLTVDLDGRYLTSYTDTNDIDYINSASFNTTNGVLTLSGVGNAGATVDLDGRYQLSGSYLTAESDTLASVTGRGATTSVTSTFSGGINVADLTNGGITGSNYNITGVNAITINDPGEGIIWGGGTNVVTLYNIDDANDNIMNFSGAAELRVNNSKVATETYVNTQVANLVDTAPTALDTLNELAAALGDDPNFATTVSNQIGLKQDAATALTTSTQFGGDVSGTYNNIVVANDSHSHSNYITSNAADTATGKIDFQGSIVVSNPVGTGHIQMGNISNDQGNGYIRGAFLVQRDQDQITYDAATDTWTHAGGGSTDWSMMAHTSSNVEFYSGPSVASSTNYTHANFETNYKWMDVNHTTGASSRTANIYGDLTVSQEITGTTGRFTSNLDASATSTGHAFQAGPTNSTNIIIDGNEIIARNNGALATLHIQTDGQPTIFGNNTVNKVSIDAGEIVATGDVCAYGTISDRRQKENVLQIDNALDKVNQLNGYTFNYIGKEDRMTGVMAQEVQEVLPEAVFETKAFGAEESTMAVRHGNMVGLLIEAIKELTEQNRQLAEEIKQLKNKP